MPRKPSPTDATLYVQPAVRSQRVWTPALVRAAETQADGGSLRLAADLCEAMLCDDRIQAVADASADALLGLPLSFEPAGDKRRQRRAVRALEAEEDFWSQLPEAELKRLIVWGRMLGVQPAQIAWSYGPTGRLLGKLDPWHARFLGWDTRERVWTIDVDGTNRQPIEPGAGQWLLFTPFGAARPWASGLWRALSRFWLLKQYAIDDWAAFGENAKRGVVESPEGATREQRRQLANDIYEAGRDGIIALPPGFKFGLVEASAVSRDIYDAQIAAANTAFAILWRGGNLSTEATGGSLAAATSQAATGDLVKVRSLAQTLSTCLHDQHLGWWAEYNFSDAALAPWPQWDTDPPADKGQRADVLLKVAQAIPALGAVGADVGALLADFDIGLAETPPAAPLAPAAPAPTAAPAPAAQASTMRQRKALVEGQIWIDDLADASLRYAPDAMLDTVRAVEAAIATATDYEDLRRRLVALSGGVPESERMRDLVERSVMLALAAGNLSGSREVG